MNKWVVLVLMTLAFLAGGLSFMTVRKDQAGPPVPSTPVPPSGVVASATPGDIATPLAATRLGRANDPHFGNPPKPGEKRSPGASPFGPDGGNAPAKIRGEINALIFSNAADGESRTRFPANTQNIYMTMTPIGLDDIELEASLRSVMVEDAPFSAPVQSSGPPRRRTFRFAPPKGGWVSGPYQVVIKPVGGEQQLKLERFEIEKKGAPAAPTYEKAEYLNLVKDITSEGSSAVFDDTDEQVYLRVASYEVPPGVKVRSVWSAVEVEQLTPGELVAVSEMSAPGAEQDALFTFAPPKGGFLPGSYRVDVYFDQQQVGSQAFFIQPAPEPAAVSGTTATASGTP